MHSRHSQDTHTTIAHSLLAAVLSFAPLPSSCRHRAACKLKPPRLLGSRQLPTTLPKQTAALMLALMLQPPHLVIIQRLRDGNLVA